MYIIEVLHAGMGIVSKISLALFAYKYTPYLHTNISQNWGLFVPHHGLLRHHSIHQIAWRSLTIIGQ